MTEPIYLISQTAAGGVRAVVCLLLIHRLLSAQRPGRKEIAAALLGCAAISVLLSVTELPDYYHMGLEIVWFTVCAVRFQKADTRMSLFISIFFCSVARSAI